jgi:inositol phosphorylceramide synthase catalytic subunit
VPRGLPELALTDPVVRAAPVTLPLEPLSRLWALWGSAVILPCLPTLYVIALVVGGGDLRPEHLGFSAVALGLGLIGPRSAELYRDLLPFVLTSLGYDCVRYPRALWVHSERVLGCELEHADRIFSVAGTTLPAWFSVHHTPAADALAAVPYAAFVPIALGSAIWLWFRDRPRMRWFLWAFALANAISFVAWLAVPAAPPWYLHAHGCVIDMRVPPNPAGLARVDQLLGIHYFTDLYSRAASVFGALPSMHCAYPVLGLLTSWSASGKRMRAVHLVYAAWMAWAAVYLEHHWVLDVLAGWATAAVGVAAAAFFVLRQKSAASARGVGG